MGHVYLLEEEEEAEDYKLWPVNKSDRSWKSLSNPASEFSSFQLLAQPDATCNIFLARKLTHNALHPQA